MADTPYERTLNRTLPIVRGWDAVGAVYRNIQVNSAGRLLAVIKSLILDNPVWEDHRFPASNPELDTATSRLSVDHANLGTIFPTNSRLTDVDAIGVIDQTSHMWKLATDIHPHIHWIQTIESATPHWVLSHRVYGAGEVPPAWTTEKWATNEVAVYAAGMEQLTTFPAIDMSAYTARTDLSIIIDMKLYRDISNTSGLFAGVDGYGATVLLKELDNHYQVDSLGSVLEYMK